LPLRCCLFRKPVKMDAREGVFLLRGLDLCSRTGAG
jgi:hypothetical protein